MTESQSARRTETGSDDPQRRKPADGSGPVFKCEGCGCWVPETRYWHSIRVGPDGSEQGGHLGECCHPCWHFAGEVAL